MGSLKSRRFRIMSAAIVAACLSAGMTPAYAEDAPSPGTSEAPVGPSTQATEPPSSEKSEAAAVKEATSSGAPVVVDSLTTESSVTTAQPDGTVKSEISSEPVRVKEGTTWHQIDTDLKSVDQEGKSRLVPEHVFADVSLAKGGSDVMAYVGDHRGAAVTQKWPFGALPEPVVEGDTATYSEVLPGVDLVQLARPTGVSQVLKVKTREALSDPRVAQMRFFLHADGATVKDRGDGKGLVAVTADGKAALQTAEGQWWDSSWDGSTAAGPGGPGLVYPLSLSLGTEGDQQVQKLGMNGILTAKKLTFPVFVDPDWTTNRDGYTYVDSFWPTMSYWNGGGGSDGSVHVGYLPPEWDYTYGASHVTRGHYQFTTSALAGKKIIKAVMNTTEVWSPSCTARPVTAYATSTVGAGTTWNSQPAWGTKFSTANVAKGNSSSCPGGTVGFDMAAGKNALSTDAQWSVGLKADNESDSLGWKRFSNAASLIVTYDTPPTTPTIYTIDGGLWDGDPYATGSRYVTRFSAPFYKVRSGDPDGAVGGNITVAMKVTQAANGALMFSGTSAPGSPTIGTLFMWQGGSLPDGRYVLSATATDAQGYSSGTMTFIFYVDTTPPKSPTIVAPSSVTSTGTNQGTTTAEPGKTQLDFIIKDGGDYGVDSFIYAVSKVGETVTYPGTMACGTRKGVFVSVCASGNAATVQVGAIDKETVIRAWAFDEAGNVDNDVNSTLPTTYTLTTTGRATLPENLATVTPSGGAEWTNIGVSSAASVPAGNSCTGTVSEAGPDQRLARALNIGASGARAQTSGSAVDTSKAFTVAAWVCPKTTAGLQSIMTQLSGSAMPAARLAILTSGGAPRYSLQAWPSTGTSPDAVVNTNSGITPGTWSYVVGAYDPANRQMRIMVTSGGFVTTWITATSSKDHLASSATQPVVFGDSGTVGSEQFTGQIFRPVMAQGVLMADQLGFLSDSFDLHGEEGLLK
ncbi:LamG-like jellyroll fold domain-containing protein [Arthrobacter woluwensis]|uniref:LamG-like jellyroll fold domain-containing protein n=1 Tax=Arthrobacter woluwensis TaxID=156980 RepID=UPI0038173DE0